MSVQLATHTGHRGIHALWHRDGAPISEARGASLLIQAPTGCLFRRESLVLALDLRLDNRREVAAELGVHPAHDADLIAAAYLRRGLAFVNDLIGDFAIIIWDERRRRLVAARDVMGARPLYYRRQGETVGVACYARDLHGCHGFGEALCDTVLAAWAHKGYDEHASVFDQVFFVPPGAVYAADARRVDMHLDHPFRQVKPLRYQDPRDYAVHFRDLLKRCITDRCRDARGPVGITLSGGMDSTTVAAVAREAGVNLQPYSFWFKTLHDSNERNASLAVARHLGLPDPIWIDCEQFWLFQGAFDQMPLLDDPFQSWDTMDRWILADLKGRGGDVLLTGHGGDSLFTGLSDGVLAGARVLNGDVSGLGALYRFGRRKGLSLPQTLYRYVVSPKIPSGIRNRIKHWLGHQKDMYPWIALSPKDYVSLITRCGTAQSLFWDAAAQALSVELTHHAFSIRRLMHWHTRLAAPLGVRPGHPLYDRRLAAFVLSVPPALLRLAGRPKGFLREAMRDRLPREVTENVAKPSLFSYYHYGFKKEEKGLKALIQSSPLADRGIVGRGQLAAAVSTYLEKDPKSALAYFGPTVLTDLWLRREIQQ